MIAISAEMGARAFFALCAHDVEAKKSGSTK
jgi:hypothetical protein